MKRPAVAIIQQYLAHYHAPFFCRLGDLCESLGIEVVLYYGAESGRHIRAEVPDWCVPIRVKNCCSVTWQPAFSSSAEADLVIVEQAVKHLILYPLLARRAISRQKLAFWGHGKNFQARNPNSLQERLKRVASRHVDWWFAYNELSASVVRDLGFPGNRITSVQNSIDTKALDAGLAALDKTSTANLKSSLAIDSDNIGVYTGGLYSEKRIPFLLQTASLIRTSIPDFHLIIIGQGPDDRLVRRAAQNSRWIHYVGPKNDHDKIPYWAISKVFLMPGLVGLAILDSFALGVPMVTTAYPYHSPEIDYLRNGINGVMVDDWQSPNAYAQRVIDVLKDDRLRSQLIEGCRHSASLYTAEEMAKRFAHGVEQALAFPKNTSQYQPLTLRAV